MVPFNSVKSLLAIIPSKRINVLLIDNSCRKSTLRNIHWREELPLIFLNVVVLTAIQKDILIAIVAAHNINIRSIDDGRVLFSHLVHAGAHDYLALIVQILVHSGRRATASDQSIAIG